MGVRRRRNLLEAQPPGPELVAAYAQLASMRALAATMYQEAIAAAERTLTLAAELALPVPPGALGARGFARCYLGDRQGLDDMRRALELALEQGRGRQAAVLLNNIAVAVWLHEGPQAGLDACREGIDFCERRGIAEFVLGIGSMSTTFLAELGRPEQTLAEAGPLAERLQAAGDINFTEARSLLLHLLAERGTHEHAPDPDELVAKAHESGQPAWSAAVSFAAGAELRLAQGRPQQAKELLAELGQVPGVRADPYYAAHLPELVRTALAVEDPKLAGRLVDGVEPVTPLAGHALAACRAQLAEADGDHTHAATLHGEAAERWRDFGNVPERAYALLGQGRCLLALGDAGAEAPLTEGRMLFASMGYKPALAETETLLAEVVANAS